MIDYKIFTKTPLAADLKKNIVRQNIYPCLGGQGYDKILYEVEYERNKRTVQYNKYLQTPEGQVSYLRFLGWPKNKIRRSIIEFLLKYSPDVLTSTETELRYVDVRSLPTYMLSLKTSFFPQEFSRFGRRNGTLKGFSDSYNMPREYYESIYRYLVRSLAYIDLEKALLSLENNGLPLDLAESLIREVIDPNFDISVYKTRSDSAVAVRDLILKQKRDFTDELSHVAPALIFHPKGKYALGVTSKYGDKLYGPETVKKEEVDALNLCSETNIKQTEIIDLLEIVEQLGIVRYFPRGIKNYSKEEICRIIGKYFATLRGE